MEKAQRVCLCPAHAELTNVSRVIHKGPCLITGFSVAGDGAAGVANLYDGENALGEHKCRVAVLDSTTFEWNLTHPVDFDKGIYIDVNAATTFVTICYIPESWKDFA